MLVLSRRIGEQIIINGNIRITISDVRGDRVRIGIEAPDNVAVDRAEVHARKRDFLNMPTDVSDSGSETRSDMPKVDATLETKKEDAQPTAL